MKRFAYISIIMIASFSAKAQSLTVTGNWNAVVSNISVSEAGNDYSSSYSLESNNNQTIINVTASVSSGGAGLPWWWCYIFSCSSGPNPWVVNVSKTDVNWDSRLILAVQRTGNGSATGVTLGTTYQNVTNSSQAFFRGTQNTNSIPIKYKLSGVSVLIPTGSYSTNVVYTIMDL